MNRCDVVIVNFNAGGFLRDAVESVLRSPSVAHVYVVDNASADESLNLLPRDENDRLTIIRNGANLGFATACNVGLKQATANDILILNPECHVSDGAIERLITILRSADRIGMVGPHLLNPDGSEQPGGRRRLPTPSLVLFRAAATLGLRRFLPMQVPDFLLHQHPLPSSPVEGPIFNATGGLAGRSNRYRAAMVDDRHCNLHCGLASSGAADPPQSIDPARC